MTNRQDSLDKGMIHILRGMERDGKRFHQTTQSGTQFKLYVESRKMVQMNRFARQKERHRCREQMYGHQGGKAGGWRGTGVLG